MAMVERELALVALLAGRSLEVSLIPKANNLALEI